MVIDVNGGKRDSGWTSSKFDKSYPSSRIQRKQRKKVKRQKKKGRVLYSVHFLCWSYASNVTSRIIDSAVQPGLVIAFCSYKNATAETHYKLTNSPISIFTNSSSPKTRSQSWNTRPETLTRLHKLLWLKRESHCRFIFISARVPSAKPVQSPTAASVSLPGKRIWKELRQPLARWTC